MATMAEQKLTSTVYNGKQRRWDFEKYVNVHKSQHLIMDGLVEHGYTGIDPRSKVRYLLDGTIRTNKLESVKTCIMSDATLRNNFDACVTLFQDFIKQTASKVKGNPNVNTISKLKVYTGKHKALDTAEDRYYTQAEYAALSPLQRKDLAEKRLKRGHINGAKDSKVIKGKKEKGKTTCSPSKDVIKKIVSRTVAQLSKTAEQQAAGDNDDSSGSSSTDDVPTKAGKSATSGSNCTNPSLTPQSKKSK
jgi:hypothetical protein